eukprot:gene17331-biopygen4946
MNSCHKEGISDWNRAGIEAVDNTFLLPAKCRMQPCDSTAAPHLEMSFPFVFLTSCRYASSPDLRLG